MIPELRELTEQIEKMLPLYNELQNAEAKQAAENLAWNLKKVRREAGATPLDPSTWLTYSRGDFALIAAAMVPDQPGAKFAAEFETRSAGLASVLEGPPPTAIAPAPTMASTPDGAATTPPAAEVPAFDLVAFLREAASASSEKLQWETSVVDLMKLLGLDASSDGRRKLAGTLGLSDEAIAQLGSVAGNSQLHSRLLEYLQSSGGKPPLVA